MKQRKTLRRLALREYAPLAGWVLCWLAVAAAVGHADAVRLLAATVFVRSLRYLTAPSTGFALRKRADSEPAVRRHAMQVALGAEAVALLAALAGLAGLVALFLELEQYEMTLLCAILGAGLPARYFYPLIGGRSHAHFSRTLTSWIGAALVAIAWGLHGGLASIAFALAMREWLALLAALIWARPFHPKRPWHHRLHWREIADISRANASRRLTYRVGKGVLSAFLGPAGGFIARTGRGMRFDRKLERFAPRHDGALLAFMAVAAAVSIGLVIAVPEPAMLLAAASAMRVAAAAGNLLIWSRLGRGTTPPEDLDDDDDE